MQRSSSLPAVDDLQARVRQPLGHQDTKAQHTIPVVTSSTILQERETTQHSNFGLFRNCTTVFQCSRFKTDLPTYKPLHRQMSSTSQTLASKILSPWRRLSDRRQVCVLTTTVLSLTILFWTVVVLYNMYHANCFQRDIHNHSHDQQDQRWYRDAIFYEIFPASLQDTDSDGYGDFEGIIQHLDYIRDLGMTAIRLNSIFSALDYPLEFEHIIDLHTPDPHLGRQEDFRRLVGEAHARGLRVVLELNPTVTSDQYTWALHWQRGIPGYEHFYASFNRSKDPPEMENSEGPPPEDWELTQRTFGGHYVLNWSNPFVQEEYQKALNHWIDLGVDGIYMKHLDKMHVLSPLDIPRIIRQWRKILDKPSNRGINDLTASQKGTQKNSASPEHTSSTHRSSNFPSSTHQAHRSSDQTYNGSSNQPSSPSQNHDSSDQSSTYITSNEPSSTSHGSAQSTTTNQSHGRRILIVSSKFVESLSTDLGQDSSTMKNVLKDIDVLDYPILVGSGEEMAEQVAGLKHVASWKDGRPVPMWHLGSSDTFRVASRIEPRYQMAAFYLLMTLPGASSVFYGDEIGLRDSFDVGSGRVYRGGQLTPMQWTSDNSTSGGFTDNSTEPWLPPNPDHASTNVQRQQNRLQEFKRLVTYRKNTLRHYCQQGPRFDVLEPNVVVLERDHKTHKSKKVLMSANFGNVSEEKDFPEAYGNVKTVMTTSDPTRTRVRSRGFTVSPGAAFIAEVSLQHFPSPIIRIRRD